MECLIKPLLEKNMAEKIIQSIEINPTSWESGKNTAGSLAAKQKNNLQLSKKSEIAISNSNLIVEEITSDQLIKSFALPRKVHSVMFTKTCKGQGYGSHIDNAYMSTGRSDLSFTLFLNDPNEYEGGELSIQSLQDEKTIKLPKGHIVIYPSTTLHSVNKVTAGERIVCVGWIQSYVVNNEDRNLLFGLDAGARGILANSGRSKELDLVFQAYSNLLRRLGD
ncbi:Fe2+-dependent dioxygenase [Prochlorococcus marinus]|uniref:Fe2+-dependent dioxygenase n=1 Tax=Prochlorococcus marinus TaxID=1219 RepID=UPI0022B2C74F|nr:Fe2+-dependent dioxygenase [Prochlorococcus marinus]